MDVELRHLRCLVAIADTGGFTGAATELGVTQPSVSRALAALESALGVRVLRRTSREVVLTAAGERVLARARRVLAEVEDSPRRPAVATAGSASATHGPPSANTPSSCSGAGRGRTRT
jgi:DNA-binding transcriptional LysR family regulator